jgi:hypothetical protein
VIEVRRGSLTGDFDLLMINHDAAAGTLRVGLGRSSGPIEGRGSGSVLEMVFRIRPDAPPGRAVINLRENVDQTTTQLNEGRLDLNPDPSNRAGDRLDGAIAVGRPVPVVRPSLHRSKAMMSASVAELIDAVLGGWTADYLPLLTRGRRG